MPARFLLAVLSLVAVPPIPAQETPSPPVSDVATGAREQPASDKFTARLGAGAAATLTTGDAGPGRLILFFIRDHTLATRRLQNADPMHAPFYFVPQPLAAVDVTGMKEDSEVVVDGSALAWPVSFNDLDGEFRVQAVYRRNREARGHLAEGNLYSSVRSIELAADSVDSIAIELTRVMQDKPVPTAPNMKQVEIKSTLLSASAGRDVMMRAGVVFPKEYDNLNAKRRFWPTIYVVPGFGADHREAENYASMMATPGTELLAPQAVYVVLDPNSPLGHHGFVNSLNHGLRGDALVRELIPALEERFRLIAKPEARIITGHSSGGWASLWLGLRHPETFGACFASAPDPVDFSAFQTIDIYADASMFADTEGRERPSFRQALGPTDDRVMMTVREEVGVEHVLSPRGESGEQWGAWAAMFSQRDPTTRLPRQLFDPVTGAIDHDVAEREWSRFDISRMVEADWPRYGPILATNVRLLCGERDSYYLNLAVEKLRAKVHALREREIDAGRVPAHGAGYIELIRNATHENLTALTTVRWNGEMIEHLHRAGCHE